MAGKYQKYPEYKDSGVEWLGKIPNLWLRYKFKYIAKHGKVFVSGPFGSSIGSRFYKSKGVPVIRGNNLSLNGENHTLTIMGMFFKRKKADELSNANVITGDLIFTARGTVGQVGLVPNTKNINWKRAILSANQLRYRNKNPHIDSLFIWYLFSSWFINTQIILSSDSVAQPNLNLGSLKDIHILIPTYQEQTQIAKFLDHETARIDTLIEKQQELIKLLKEKRQAVISHAVTKGLNPNAPMKDSGVEWLGEVPNHWEVILFKRIIKTIKDGTHGTFNRVIDGLPFLSAKNVHNDGIKINDTESMISINDYNEITKNGFPAQNDLLITCVGTIGRVCVYKYETPFAFQRSVVFLRFNKDIYTKFYKYFVESKSYQSQLESKVKASAQGGVYMGDLIETTSVTIPYLEQTQIANFLDKETETNDYLVNQSKLAIQLLKERRTALISAAVTGKIDVRDWKAPEDKRWE